MLQALPALFSEPLRTEEELETAVAALDPVYDQYAAELERALQEKQDLIIDFTSLKTCLDPTSTFENQQQSVSLIIIYPSMQYCFKILTPHLNCLLIFSIQFDYEGYIFDFLDKQPEKLSSLQSLSVRKLKPPTKRSSDDEHDRCKLITVP